MTNSLPLIDPFKRRIEYLRLSVTDLCNFRCTYCLPNGYQKCNSKPQYLTINEISTLIEAFSRAGTKKIRLTGGEPMLRKDIVEIAELCSKQPGIEKVALTTNGYRLETQYKSLIDAGISQFNVSIDSFDPISFQKITGKKTLANILYGVEKIIDAGVRVKINAVLMKSTYDTIVEDTLAFVKDRPIVMRFIELMRTGDNVNYYNSEHICSHNLEQQLLNNGWILRERSPMDGPAKEFTHPDYLGGIGIIAPYSKNFCRNCNRLRVTSLGKLHLCLFDTISYDLRPYLTSQDAESLINELHEILIHKPEKHRLHSNNPGIMKYLAQIGG